MQTLLHGPTSVGSPVLNGVPGNFDSDDRGMSREGSSEMRKALDMSAVVGLMRLSPQITESPQRLCDVPRSHWSNLTSVFPFGLLSDCKILAHRLFLGREVMV